MAKITVSKEKECELLWRFVASVSDNTTVLASVVAKVCKTIDEHHERLTDVEGNDEPDWKEISMMLLGTVDGFMEFVKKYCLAYTNVLRELKGSLSVSEETDEEVE